MSDVTRTDGNEEGSGTSSSTGVIKSILRVRTASTSSGSSDLVEHSGLVLPSDSPLAPASGAIQWLLDLMDTAVTTDEQRVKLGTVKEQLHNILRTLPIVGRAADDLHHCYSLLRERNREKKALEEQVASLTAKVRQLEDNDKAVEFFVEEFSSEHEKRVKAENALEEVKKQLELLQRPPTVPADEEGPSLPIVPLSSVLEISDGLGVGLEGVGEQKGNGTTSPAVPAEVQQVVDGGDGDTIRLVPVEAPDNFAPPEVSGENSMTENANSANLLVIDQEPSVIADSATDPVLPPPTRNAKNGYNLRRRGNTSSGTTSHSLKVTISNSKKVVPQSANTAKPMSDGKAPSKVVPAPRSRAKANGTAKSFSASAGDSPTVPEKPFRCQECGSSFKTATQLTKHMYIHQPESKPFACTGYGYCDKRFYDRCALKIHIRSHTGDRPFPCSKCEKRFISKHGLKCHQLTHDKTRTRDFACDLCSRTCFTNVDLLNHKKIHLTVRAWQCPLCTRAFKTQGELKKHQVVHSSEKKFRCRSCPRRFKRSSQLRLHEDWHQGIRNHECDVCGKRFPRNFHLVEHMRTHTGEKPHKCRYCGKAFRQKNRMRYHESHLHPDQAQD